MKALILAAGFGTRLEKSLNEYEGPYKKELTAWVKGKPKGLVPVSGKPIVEHQLDQLVKAGVELKDIYVYTNQMFYPQYLNWAVTSGIPGRNIFNNGVSHNEERKEQVQDLLSAIEKIGYEKPLFVFASDTLVYDSNNRLLDLSSMAELYQQEGFSGVVAYYKERGASGHGVITVDEENQLTSFREKPLDVEAGLVNASVYLFSPSKLNQMKNSYTDLIRYKNPLQVVWDGFKIVGAAKRIDLGTIDDLLSANSLSSDL